MTSEERIAAIERRLDGLRDKLGDVATQIYLRIDVERRETDSKIRGSRPSWWIPWAKFALFGTTAVVLAAGVGMLVVRGVLPKAVWDNFWDLLRGAG